MNEAKIANYDLRGRSIARLQISIPINEFQIIIFFDDDDGKLDNPDKTKIEVWNTTHKQCITYVVFGTQEDVKASAYHINKAIEWLTQRG